MAAIEFDDSRWPLVVVTFRGEITDAEFNAYLKALERNLERCEKSRVKTAILFDTENGGASNAAQRKAQSEWIKKHFQHSAKWCVGYAFAIPSAIVRGMLQAIFWLSPMPSEHIVVKTRAEAELWLSSRLERAKLSNVGT